MLINTTRFGDLEIDTNDIIEFKDGIMGFEEYKRYTLFSTDDDSFFKWMQSCDEPSLAFILIKPDEFYPNYGLNISDDDAVKLKITDTKMLEIYAIVVIPDDPTKMTANLQGPIVINWICKQGKQIISLDPKHKLRHYILEEMKKNADKLSKSPKNNNEGDK